MTEHGAPPADEMVDGNRRVRPHWTGLFGILCGLDQADLAARARLLDRAFEEEGSAGLLPAAGAAGRGVFGWRLDPLPLLLDAAEFAALSDGLTQRANLLEAILADLYGPQRLLAERRLPPEAVFPNPDFLRPCRHIPTDRYLHSYAADLLRGPDGAWRVVGESASATDGLAMAFGNRAHLARALPEAVRAVQMRPLRPFLDAWREALQREAGQGEAAVALLTPGVGHPAWAEHVTLARDLSCALAEPGDLTARGGAVYLKALRGLRPVRVLVNRVAGRLLDPLEGSGPTARGVPGLLDALRAGQVAVRNHPGAALAEAPILAAFLEPLCRALLGQDLLVPSAETLWLGDPAALARWRADSAGWSLRPAARAGETAPDADAPGDDPRAWVAVRPPRPSVAPSLVEGGMEPRPVSLRLFLIHDGAAWRALPGGLARVEGAAVPTAKDVWVLAEERAEIRGPGTLHLPALAIRRSAGDLPSRVADNLFWLGRYVERLDDAARLMRATLARLDRAPPLPRDVAELAALGRCLVGSKVIAKEDAPASGADAALRRALLRAGTKRGELHRLTGEVARLVEGSRDRLTGDMHAAFTVPLRDARAALASADTLPALGAALGGLVRYASGVAGVAAENMVRGGAHTFLDLGRRMERAASVAAMLGQVLAEPPARAESGLTLALELCDSVITYRTRYLHVLQAGPALDLVLADPGNPRGLAFQLAATASLLLGVEGGGDPTLSATASRLRAAAEAMAAEVATAADGNAAAVGLSPRLLDLEERVGDLSDAVGRRYFTLLSAPRLLGVDTAAAVKGAA